MHKISNLQQEFSHITCYPLGFASYDGTHNHISHGPIAVQSLLLVYEFCNIYLVAYACVANSRYTCSTY